MPVVAPTIAAGGVLEDKVVFDFCSKWNGFVKTAVFWLDKGEPYEVVLDKDDSCVIPFEVLTNAGNLFFGVYGVNADGVKRTSEVIKYKIEKGAGEGIEHADPTPDMYEQLLERIAEIEAGGGTVTDEQIATAVESYLAENPVVGTPGADGKSAYEIWLAEGNTGTEADFLASFKGEKGDKGDPYTLTDEDKTEIVNLVLAELPETTTYTGEVEVE